MNSTEFIPLYLLFCSVLIFLMQPGFLCLEAGYCRNKNNINIAAKNICDFALTALIFWAVGYGLGFGDSSDGWLGTTDFMFATDGRAPTATAYFIYQLMFAGTCVSILSGAVAERMRFVPYMVSLVFITAIIYPVFAHWVWAMESGEVTGWLASKGFVDFAGTSVVHSTGGWISLAALLAIGPRTGRFDQDGEPNSIPASNLPFAMLGVLLLWVGWFGFNCGSAYLFTDRVPGIFLNTVLGGAAGLATGVLLSFRSERSYVQVPLMITGTLAGLVSITAACHAITPGMAIPIGAIGALIAISFERWLLRKRIDDVVGAVPVHLAAGIWGTVAVVFGSREALGTGLSIWDQLWIQFAGVAVCGAWSFLLSFALFKILDRIMPLRVSREDEQKGLNISEHGAQSDLFEVVTVMNEQAWSGDLSLRVPEEPFTQVGEFARCYNVVLESLQYTSTHVSKLVEKDRQLQQTLLEQRQTEEKLHEVFQESEQAREKAETQALQLIEQTKALTLAKQEALSASRAKSDFLSQMSHEIRTPLTAILGYTEGILDEEELNVGVRDSVEIVLSSADHLLQIVNDILDLSKMESGKLELEVTAFSPFKLSRDVELVLAGKIAEKGIEFQLQIEYPMPRTISSDYLRLKQVLINLIGNAIKFTDQGKVETTFRFNSVDEELTLEVKDTGVGIGANALDGLFQPFVQADATVTRRFGGTGLGLSISRKIVEALGGHIRAESTLGEGSVFTVTIPIGPVESEDVLQSYQPEVTDRAARPVPSVCLHGKVLVVEDGDDIRDIMCYFLRGANIEVSIATNGEEGVAKALAEEYDLVFMDVQMPVMDGITATKLLREKGFTRPIVAVTANQLAHQTQECLDAGCTQTLRKPFRRDELIAMAGRFMGGEKSAEEAAYEQGCDAIVENYREKLPGRIREIEEALETRNLEAIGFSAHRLVGAGLFGFDELSQVARELESACRDGSHDKVGELIVRLREVVMVIAE